MSWQTVRVLACGIIVSLLAGPAIADFVPVRSDSRDQFLTFDGGIIDTVSMFTIQSPANTSVIPTTAAAPSKADLQVAVFTGGTTDVGLALPWVMANTETFRTNVTASAVLGATTPDEWLSFTHSARPMDRLVSTGAIGSGGGTVYPDVIPLPMPATMALVGLLGVGVYARTRRR